MIAALKKWGRGKTVFSKIILLGAVLSFIRCSGLYSKEEHSVLYSQADTILTPMQLLGKQLFFDKNLSDPAGRSCASCHVPEKGFAHPENQMVSQGAVNAMFGRRNASSVAYASFSPYFKFDSIEQAYVGGQFWDGRANTLCEQAKHPLLSHIEMNNRDKRMVTDRVKTAVYKDLFIHVFGPRAFDNTDNAFDNIAEAIEEYETTAEVSPFTSKFDYYLKGLARLSESELRGLKLFNDPAKGNCAACHPSTPDKTSRAVLFTDFTYDNLGVPVNNEIMKLCKEYQTDLGLGAIVGKTSENGKFKVPSLRNAALTAPYFHNGFFKTLEEVVQFYNERDSGKFGSPEVPENMNKEELGNLKLTQQEIKDIVAFMQTLTDGFIPGLNENKEVNN